MEYCPTLATCPFYNDKMSNKPATANMFKRNYCKNDYSTCARWKVSLALGKDAVPGDLFPNENERANRIIEG